MYIAQVAEYLSTGHECAPRCESGGGEGGRERKGEKGREGRSAGERETRRRRRGGGVEEGNEEHQQQQQRMNTHRITMTCSRSQQESSCS